jgi:hypothetical protein
MKATHDERSLSAVAERISEALGNLRNLIGAVKAHHIESIPVQYQREMERGLNGIEDWIQSGHRSLRRALIEAGHFQAEPSEGATPVATANGTVDRVTRRGRRPKK